jgi:hypothetical protein
LLHGFVCFVFVSFFFLFFFAAFRVSGWLPWGRQKSGFGFVTDWALVCVGALEAGGCFCVASHRDGMA